MLPVAGALPALRGCVGDKCTEWVLASDVAAPARTVDGKLESLEDSGEVVGMPS